MAGFQHETNTFSPIPAHYEDFVRADLWPKMLLGEEMFPVFEGMNLPSAGFMEAARLAGDELIPLIWCSAEPCGTVEDKAFEQVVEELRKKVMQTADIDALYLDLHGAMVTESYDDGEGELLTRLRQVLGKDIPIVVSLDFHANISPAMVEQSDLISIYRTYPHVDMFETGERAHRYLQSWFSGGLRHKCFRQVPYLIPLSAQCTQQAPNRQLFKYLESWDKEQKLGVEMALGFPPADIPDAGPAIVAYGNDIKTVKDSVQKMYSAIMEAELIYKNELLSPGDALQRAETVKKMGPVILADVQDNPGAGATCDTTGILSAMIDAGSQQGLVGVLCDPSVVVTAHQLGEGATFNCRLGNRFGYDQQQVEARWQVEKISNGRFSCTGEMYRGAMADVGPLALLRLLDEKADISVVVSHERFQCVDRSVFEHLGLQVESYQLVVLKSTVHFRADFDSIAALTLQVESPGAHPCRLTGLAYKHLRQGVRLEPCGPAFNSSTNFRLNT